jgi:N-acylneuraminate cytidylyltransferase
MDFCGKPLIGWSIEQAFAALGKESVYVSTDDGKIADISAAYGAKIIWRPAELASDLAGMEPTIAHAVEQMESAEIIVHLQVTSPVRSPSDISNAVRIMEGCDAVFSAVQLDDICLWREADGSLESFTYDYRNRGRRQDRKPYFLENGSIYAFRSSNMKTFNNRLGGKMAKYLMPTWKSYEIDSLDDIAVCEFFMKKLLREYHD